MTAAEKLLAALLASNGLDDITYDSNGLGKLYYVTRRNKLVEVNDEAELRDRLSYISDSYIQAAIKGPTTVLNSSTIPFCHEIENNHVAHVEFLHRLYRGETIPPDTDVAREWDRYCKGSFAKESLEREAKGFFSLFYPRHR